MVVEGDTLLHLLVRNDAHKDTVEACFAGVRTWVPSMRGEQVLGLARKRQLVPARGGTTAPGRRKKLAREGCTPRAWWS